MRYTTGTWRLFRPAFSLLALAVASSCRADGPARVRVGYAAEIPHAVGIVGFSPQKQSFYKAFPGVWFDNTLTTGGPAAIEALRGRKIDIAFVGPAEAICAYTSYHDVLVLTNTCNSGTALIARKGSGVRSVADLQGRKVAVPQMGGTPDVLLRYQLALNGLRPEDRSGKVTLVPVESSEVPGLFTQRKLDAACLPEPWASALEKAAGGAVLLGSGQVFNEGDYPAALIVTRKDFAQANPDFIRRFTQVARAIAAGLFRRHDAYAPLLQSEVRRLSGKPVPLAAIRSALNRCHFTAHTDQHDLAVFAKLVGVADYLPQNASLEGIMWK